KEVFATRQRHSAELDLLACLNLDDRLRIVQKSDDIPPALGFSKHGFKGWAEELKRTRDRLAHGGALLDDMATPTAAIRLADDIRRFAEGAWKLTTMLASDDPG